MTSSGSTPTSVFPFGRPVAPSPPSNPDQREGFVLGAYPSGLHVGWTPPAGCGKPVKALIVDNEPTPFWDGVDVEGRTDRWRHHVGWDEAWGTVKAVPGHNGPSGKWVTEHILEPLGLSREQVSISDCLNMSRLNPGQAGRVADTYAPFATRLGLPACTLQPVPAGESGILKEATDDHLDRLRAELREAAPTRVVTLGNAAMRVLARIVNIADGQLPRGLTHDGYGTLRTVNFEGRDIQWIPLVHPRNGERDAKWSATHTTWESTTRIRP